MDRQKIRWKVFLRFNVLVSLFVLLFLTLACENGLTQGGKQLEPETVSQRMQIKGKISVKGSEPHTYLCLSTASRTDYRLAGELKDLIWTRFQQEMMTLEGVVSKEALGPGFPAEFIVHKIVKQASE